MEAMRKLFNAMTKASERAHYAYTQTLDKKGKGQEFHMGYYAALDDVLAAYRTGDLTELDNAFWESRGYKVDHSGKKIKE